MSKKTTKHSKRQGHPARRHPTAQQEPTIKKANPQKQKHKLGLVDFARAGFLVLSLELAATIAGWNGSWMLAVAGIIWTSCVLVPILLRRPEKMGVWMLALTGLLLALIFSQPMSSKSQDTPTAASPAASSSTGGMPTAINQPAAR